MEELVACRLGEGEMTENTELRLEARLWPDRVTGVIRYVGESVLGDCIGVCGRCCFNSERVRSVNSRKLKDQKHLHL